MAKTDTVPAADGKKLKAALSATEKVLSSVEKANARFEAVQKAAEELAPMAAQLRDVVNDYWLDVGKREREAQEVIAKIDAYRAEIVSLEKMKVPAAHEMLHRRCLEGRKTVQEMYENWEAKVEKANKNPADKRAQMEAELASKAFDRAATDLQKLEDEAERLFPLKHIKFVDQARAELKPLIADYAKLVKAALEANHRLNGMEIAKPLSIGIAVVESIQDDVARMK